MSHHRFFINKNRIKGHTVTIVGPPVWHIKTVLRLQKGNEVVLFPGDGSELLVRLIEVRREEIFAEIIARRSVENASPVRLTLFYCHPRSKVLDIVLQKATELGVSAIQILTSERSAPLERGKTVAERQERWRQITIEAACQSGRTTLPELPQPTSLCETLSTFVGKQVFRLDPHATSTNRVEHLFCFREVGLIIGPEGGFSPAESILLDEHGVAPIALGPRILRSETAVLAALTLFQYHLGDLSHTSIDTPWRYDEHP